MAMMGVLVGCDRDDTTPLPKYLVFYARPLYSLCDYDYKSSSNLHPLTKTMSKIHMYKNHTKIKYTSYVNNN